MTRRAGAKNRVHTVTTVSELIQGLSGLRKDAGLADDHVLWYRGQAMSGWGLQPRVFRSPAPKRVESDLLNLFRQRAAFLLHKHPTTDFDWLFLMQHYGVPTRLLDWSESPLIALWFAIENLGHDRAESAFWVLSPTILNEHAHYRPTAPGEIPAFGDSHLRQYSPETYKSETSSSLLPCAAIATRNSARISAQLGVFTISHRELGGRVDDLGLNKKKSYFWKFCIPANAKAGLRNELRLLGLNEFALFPELDRIYEAIQ